MPLYEYRCGTCDMSFERLEPFSAPAVKTCPECGGQANRLLGVPLLHFKGSGWYVTDYAKRDTSSEDGVSAASKHNPTESSKPADKQTAA